MSARSPSAEGAAEPASPHHRRRLRAVLLAIAVIGLAGGSWWADRNRAAAPLPGAVPEIHADPAPVKEAPRDPGGMVVPDQDSALLNRNAKPKIEELLPPPEAALPRPAVPPQPSVSVATPSVAAAAGPAPGDASAGASITAAPPAAAPAPPPPQLTATVTKPLATPPASPAVKTPASAGGGYRLQLGALRSEAAAQQEWQRLQHQASDVLGHLGMTVSRIDLGEKGSYYRIQAGPIAEEGVASAACSILKNRNIGCILVKP